MTAKLLIALAIVATSGTGMSESLTSGIRSGYTGWFINRKDGQPAKMPDRIVRAIDAMAKNGFNAIDVKILGHNNSTAPDNFSLKKDWDSLKEGIDYAKAKGLAFNVYLYPRCTPAKEWLATIDQFETWSNMYSHAYQFAKAHKELGFNSLRFDIEIIQQSKRWDVEGMGRIANAVRRWIDSIRELAPDLPLGYMPAGQWWLSDPFDKYLATGHAPAFMDGWVLYNGNNYSKEIIDDWAARLKAKNPNNRCIPWIRPNAYRLDDIASVLFNAAKVTDGYSMYSLSMLDPGEQHKKPGDYFALPGGESVDSYYAELKRVNDALVAGKQISLKQIQAIVHEINLENFRFPKKGEPFMAEKSTGSITLRDQRTAFIVAKRGEPIRVTLAQLAGERRPIGLNYQVLAPNGDTLRHEHVTPGARETWEVLAPEDGVYAVVATAGKGGQAWWSIQVHNLPWCVDGRGEPVYVFGPQTFRVPGPAAGNPVACIKVSEPETYRYRVDFKGEWETISKGKGHGVEGGQVVIPLEGSMSTLEFQKIPGNGWCQDFYVSFRDGTMPYVFAK